MNSLAKEFDTVNIASKEELQLKAEEEETTNEEKEL